MSAKIMGCISIQVRVGTLYTQLTYRLLNYVCLTFTAQFCPKHSKLKLLLNQAANSYLPCWILLSPVAFHGCNSRPLTPPPGRSLYFPAVIEPEEVPRARETCP